MRQLALNQIGRTLGVLATAASLLAVAPHARAGEITVFLSRNSPTDVWGTGQGAALTMGLLKFVQLETEGARVASSASDTRMTYFTPSAALKLPFTRFTPYAGVGVGLCYQSQGDKWKIQTLDAAFIGAKVRLADLIVLRAEYRRFALHGQPFLILKERVSFGAGIAF